MGRGPGPGRSSAEDVLRVSGMGTRDGIQVTGPRRFSIATVGSLHLGQPFPRLLVTPFGLHELRSPLREFFALLAEFRPGLVEFGVLLLDFSTHLLAISGHLLLGRFELLWSGPGWPDRPGSVPFAVVPRDVPRVRRPSSGVPGYFGSSPRGSSGEGSGLVAGSTRSSSCDRSSRHVRASVRSPLAFSLLRLVGRDRHPRPDRPGHASVPGWRARSRCDGPRPPSTAPSWPTTRRAVPGVVSARPRGLA